MHRGGACLLWLTTTLGTWSHRELTFLQYYSKIIYTKITLLYASKKINLILKIYSAHINSFSAVFKTQNVSQVSKLQQKRNIALTTCRQIQKKRENSIILFCKALASWSDFIPEPSCCTYYPRRDVNRLPELWDRCPYVSDWRLMMFNSKCRKERLGMSNWILTSINFKRCSINVLTGWYWSVGSRQLFITSYIIKIIEY